MWWIQKRLLDEAVDDLGCLVGPLVYLATTVLAVLILVEALLGHGPLRLLAILVIAAAGAFTLYDSLA